MSSLSEIVSITITQDTVGIARAGFGVPLVLSHNATYPERVRYYSDTSEAIADWPASSPEYIAINAILSQSPSPEEVGVGRCAVKPTQQYAIGAAAIRNSDSSSYKINAVGQGVTSSQAAFTSDASATAQEIHNGLVIALNAVVGKNYTAAFAPLASLTGLVVTADSTTDKLNHVAHGWNTGDGPIQFTNSGGGLPAGIVAVTNYFVIKVDADNFQIATTLALALAGTQVDITTNGTGTQTATPTGAALSPILPFLVTGNAAGNWFSLEVTDVSALSNKETHADPGLAAELDAINLEQPDWYCLLTNYNSSTYSGGAAAWTEGQTKIYLFDSPCTDAINVVVGSGTDVLATLHALAYTRTAGSYHSAPAAMLSASWAGTRLPTEPGSETWKFASPAGVAPSNLTTTHRTNLRARKANWLQTVGGRNIMQDGTVFSGGYIDQTRGLDWLNDDMTKGIYGALVSVAKIPYTDQGVTIIENEIIASLDRAITNGILASTPKPVIIVPLVASIADTDRANRLLPNLKFSATMAGAVHKVTVKGVVSV